MLFLAEKYLVQFLTTIELQIAFMEDKNTNICAFLNFLTE